MKKLMTNLILLAFFVLSISQALAASCPYCGRTYGAAAPGDSARINALRREHEASCPARQSSRSSRSTRPQHYTSPSSQRVERQRATGTVDQRIKADPHDFTARYAKAYLEGFLAEQGNY